MLDKTRKPLFTQLEKHFFFREKSHSAENLKQSSMLEKRFLSSESRGGSTKKNWREVA